MKTLLSFILVAAFTTLFAQTGGMAEFKLTAHNFGKIKQGKPVTTEFEFTNKGTKNLIVEDATAECGCTTPEFEKTPIGKNKTSIVKVTYNAENPGVFKKKVTVKFLGIKESVVLTISGEVETP